MGHGSSRICIFVRHGEGLNNVSHLLTEDLEGYPLTDGGALAVDEAGRALSKVKVSRIYSSPVLRARQSAEIISRHVGAKVEINGLLKERGVGRYNNMVFAGRKERLLTMGQIKSGYPDFESWKSVSGRMVRFSRVVKEGETSIAVSHLDPIKAIIARFSGRDESSMLDTYIVNCSFTVIDFSNAGQDAVLAVGSSKLPKELLAR